MSYQYVLTPAKKPPHPSSVTGSAEVEAIWSAICEKHEQNKQRRQRPDTGLSYYQTMYNRAFRSNQSSRNTQSHGASNERSTVLNTTSQYTQPVHTSNSQNTESPYSSYSQYTEFTPTRSGIREVPSSQMNPYHRSTSVCGGVNHTASLSNIHCPHPSGHQNYPYRCDVYDSNMNRTVNTTPAPINHHAANTNSTSLDIHRKPEQAESMSRCNLGEASSNNMIITDPDITQGNTNTKDDPGESCAEFKYSQSLFSQSQTHAPDIQNTDRAAFEASTYRGIGPGDIHMMPASPPLDLDNDAVLSQLPRLPTFNGDHSIEEVAHHQEFLFAQDDRSSYMYSKAQQSKSQLVELQHVAVDQFPGYGTTESDVLKHTSVDGDGLSTEQDMRCKRRYADIMNIENALETDSIGSELCPIETQNKITQPLPSGKSISVPMETPHDVSNIYLNGASKHILCGASTVTMATPDIKSTHVLTTPMNTAQLKTPSSTIAARLSKMRNSFEASANHPDITQSKDCRGKRQLKQSKFTVPVKKTKEVKVNSNGDDKQLSDSRTCPSPAPGRLTSATSRLAQVDQLSDKQRQELSHHLQQSDEVALTLLYQDGSSQLREILNEKKKGGTPEAKAVSVAVAYPVSGNLRYVSMSLPKTTSQPPDPVAGIVKWTRLTLFELMKSKTRKLAFDSQELIETLLIAFKYNASDVVKDWTVMDAKVASWLLDPDNPPVTFKHVLRTMPHYKQKEVDPSAADVCGDLDELGPVMLHLYHKLTAHGLWTLYTNIETPLSPILACMQHRGLTVNTESMVQAGEWMKKKLKQLEKQAFQAAGHSFLINSHPQLRQVLFEELKLDEKLPGGSKIARTASNQHKSTSEAVLTQLSTVHELPAIILEYRQIQKVKSTYVDGLLPCVEKSMLYTHWDQTAAVTGRLTSTNPNIQAIPKQPLLLHGVRHSYIIGKEDEPVEILSREPFVARPGCSFVAADFQQVELRLLAHLSADSSLLSIFNQTQSTDIFIQLTSQWMGKSVEDVTSVDREQTKRIVYSVMYGVGKERLGEYLKISPDNAKCIMNSFLVRFPGINTFTRNCVAEARSKGYQSTILGRRRWFPQINHCNPGLRAQAERQAVNFCIQGSAADLCKAAMIQVEHTLADQPELTARMLVQIHDELLLEVPDDEIRQIIDILRHIMENGEGLCGSSVSLSVPITVSFTQGKSWGHMKPVHGGSVTA